MLLKRARLKIEASDTVANYGNHDFLLRGSKKTAFRTHTIGKELIKATNSIDIMAELENKSPEEWVIFRARAIDAGGLEKTGETIWGPNDNGDYFSEEELLSTVEGSNKRSFETFIGVPVFVNHENTNVEKARGKIVNAFYDKDNHCVWVDGMIDAKAYPELARAVKEGYVTDVSMGCSVKYSDCSYCGNKAPDEKSYCEHVKAHKGRKLHGKKVYEINHGIKFIELSAVVDGACENCTIHNVFSGPELINKVQEMCKVASKDKYEISDKNKIKLISHEITSVAKRFNAIKDAGIVITARGEDIDKLNKALDLLKDVSRQILESKDVDYEFLADIGDLLSELQNFIIVLVESGFANQDQPGNVSDKDVMNAISDTAPGEGATPGAGAATGTESPAATPPTGTTPPAGQTGAPTAVPQAMTMPMLANSNEKMKKSAESIKGFEDSLSELQNIVKEIRTAGARGLDMPKSRDLKRSRDASELSIKLAELVTPDGEPLVFHKGNYTTLMDNSGITAFANGRKVAFYATDKLDPETIESMKNNPQEVSEELIQIIANKIEGEYAMENNLKKEALAQNPPPVNQIQEGQLDDLDGNFKRKNHPTDAEGQIGVTTEAQLENVPKSKETGKGDWNRVRPDSGKKENLTVTEGQLDSTGPTGFGSERKESSTAVAEGQHSGTQEWQLTQSGYGSERWDDDSRDNYLSVTETQFEGKDRIGEAMSEVQEGQLAGRRQGDKSGSSKSASSDYSDRVITAFVNGLANAVADFNISPSVIASVRPNSQAIKTAKVSLSGIESDLKKSDLQRIAEYSISRSIGVNQDLASSYVDEVIDVLYSDSNRLASAVKKTVDSRIADLQKVSSGEKSASTVESKVRSAWTKKTAAPIKAQKYVFTLGEILSSVEEGKAPQISAKNINDPAITSMLSNYITEGAGGMTITNATIDESGLITVHAQDAVANKFNDTKTNVNMPNSPQPNSNANNSGQSGNSGANSSMDSGADSSVESGAEMQVAASTKEKLKKLAQSPAGTTLPPPGGAMGAPAAGGPPPGGVEALSAPETGDFEEESAPDMGMEGGDDMASDGEAKPFGAISPISGSDDVEFVDGVYKDNTTGVEYTVDVNYRILNPHVLQNPDFMKTNDDESAPDAEMTEGEGVNEELNANPAGMQSQVVPGKPPVAPGGAGGPGGGGGGLGGGLMANAPRWTKTAALCYDIYMDPMLFDSSFIERKVNGKNVKTAVFKPGHICPQCSSKNVAFGGKDLENQGLCANCGTKTYVVAEKANNGKLHVQMIVDNNIEIREAETNEFGGHAFNGPVPDRKEIQERIHTLLASKNRLIKIAQSLPDDPWLNCVSDQVADGYDGDNSIQICASLKEAYIKTAMEDDDMEGGSDDSEKDPIKKESDETVFESEKEEKSEGDSDDSEGSDDDSGSEGDSEEGDSDSGDSEFDSEMSDDDDGFEEVFEDDEVGEGSPSPSFGDIPDSEITNEDNGPMSTNKAIDVENITHIDIYGETPEGESFEIEIPVNSGAALDSPVEDGDVDILEVEEVFEGEPDDVSKTMGGDMTPEVHDVSDSGSDMGGDDEGGEDFGLGDIFTMPEDPNAVEEDESEGGDKEFASHYKETEELNNAYAMNLRKGRISTANAVGAAFLNDDSAMAKLAQAIGFSMPTNTMAEERGVDIPRDKEESGIAEDGEVLDTSDYENTASEMKGTKGGNAAGSSLSKDPAIQGSERGVRQVAPSDQGNRANKASGNSSWLKISKTEKKRNDKFPEKEFPNEEGSVNDKTKGANLSESTQKNTDPDKKRTKVHFKSNTIVAMDEGCDDMDMGKDDDKGGSKKPSGPKAPKSPSGSGKKPVEGPTGKMYTKKTKINVASVNPFAKSAQNNSVLQTEPLDSLQEDKLESNSIETSLDVPRNESKAKPQEFSNVRKDVKSPEKIREKEYKMGPDSKNLHNNGIIPRDKSGDGLGGKAVDFDKEIAVEATSGNPDSYVQEFQDSKYIDPTPAGNEDNHATMGTNTASMKAIVKKFAKIKGMDESDLEAVDFGDVIAVEQISTGKLYELKVRK